MNDPVLHRTPNFRILLIIIVCFFATETARAQKLKIRCHQNCDDKRKILESIAEELGISLGEIAFVGNDINDQPCLSNVGMPIVVNDAHKDVVSIARYKTRNPGGHGAVREVCDLFEKVLTK